MKLPIAGELQYILIAATQERFIQQKVIAQEVFLE